MIQANRGDENSFTSCDKIPNAIESKMFLIVKDFSKFAKSINEEQNNIRVHMNSTIDTINLVIEQLEENKTALSKAQKEIKKLKNEVKQLKTDKDDSSIQVMQRSIQQNSHFESQSSSDSNISFKFELDSIKAEINKLKENFKDFNNMKHDINCLKYEVKKAKLSKNFDVSASNTIIQKNIGDDISLNNINELKREVNEIKIKDKQIPLNNVESIESATIDVIDPEKELNSLIDKINIQQNKIESLNDDIKAVRNNNVNQDTIKKIKKQIKKLNNRITDLEKKGLHVTKNNNNSEEDDNEQKESETESESQNTDTNTILQSLFTRISSLESKTNEISNIVNQPKVHQIFVDLPKTKACNLLFRTPKEQCKELK